MIDRNLKFKQKSFQSAHSRLNFLLWFFQIIATCALQNFAETQPLGVQQSISERVAGDLHKTNFTNTASLPPDSPLNLGLDVIHGGDLFRLKFLLNLGSAKSANATNTTNSTRNSSAEAALRRESVLRALQDKDSPLHAALENGETAKVLKQILERRARCQEQDRAAALSHGLRAAPHRQAALIPCLRFAFSFCQIRTVAQQDGHPPCDARTREGTAQGATQSQSARRFVVTKQ